MPPKPIFDPQKTGRPMRVAGFMSGSGTNISRLLEHQRALADQGESPFELVFIFSDRSDGRCRGEEIALEAGIPYASSDIRRFHQAKGLKRTAATEEGYAARQEYDAVAAQLCKAFEIDLVALGGYMSFITLEPCVSVHPADLSILDQAGQRCLIGDDAVFEAIVAGQSELRSSTLLTDQGVDSGPLLMVSEALPVRLDAPLEQLKADPARLRQAADEYQERLKEAGDWRIFPLTIQYVAQGRFALDESGAVFFDGKPAPRGVRL